MRYAKWIWTKQKNYKIYNQTVIVRKEFLLGSFNSALANVTADSFYRLHINGRWVGDGPVRSWPHNYRYDVLDVTSYLKKGENEIMIIARFFGAGDFHRVPQQAGLCFEMEINLGSGKKKTIISDRSWDAADAKCWVSNTPKIGIQVEPYEYYDCHLERHEFAKAVELFEINEGHWKNLVPRDVALMSREPLHFNSFKWAKVVKNDGLHFCLPAARLLFPDLIEANGNTTMACGMATIISVKAKCKFRLHLEGFRATVDGVENESCKYELGAGKHLLLVLSNALFDHHGKDKVLRFTEASGLKLENPLNLKHDNPWCFIRLDEFNFHKSDMIFGYFMQKDKQIQKIMSEYDKRIQEYLKAITNKKEFRGELSGKIECLPFDDMFVMDPHWQFRNRKEIGEGSHYVDNATALMYDNSEFTTVLPNGKGDLELCYDIGRQTCGYYSFDLISEESVAIDIAGVEYITESGQVQHTTRNRNSMRYIAKKGHNSFISLRRRGGRYIFITIRNPKKPVRIRNFKVIESTYPVNHIGSFKCSDPRLEKIWDASVRTLKLCMEDTYTDCPLYEQTLWVGDARNESLFGYYVFNAIDIARQSILVAAESLKRLPIVGGQVPSTWDALLPAWSFLWVISVWEYYWHTGDLKFLKKIWPSVIKNLKGAEQMIDDNGLFSGPYWNMFDWSNADQNQKTVVHNSMFLVGAIDAALKCSDCMHDYRYDKWLKQFAHALRLSMNKYWDKEKKSYPDSIHEDGTISPSICQHTSFLSVLYDIVEKKNLSFAIKNMIKPSKNMVRTGSPFASFYLYEALEKIGAEDEIIKSIYFNYLPMIEAGSDTVWERYPGGKMLFDGFDNRSRCHAWSSSPIYFLSRIILGIRQSQAGGKAFVISPRPSGLTWAKGSIATVNGPVEVQWELQHKVLQVTVKKPDDVKITFTRNESLKGIKTAIDVIEVK